MKYPDKKYEIIYADPPWYYAPRKKGTVFGGGVTTKYPTLTPAQLCEFPVDDWAADTSILFMWVTMPYLMESFQNRKGAAQEVIEAWGFKYVAVGFTWIKTNRKEGTPFAGPGHYTMSNTELCLIGRKGKYMQRENRGIQQVIMEPRREHSRKPDRVRDDIVRGWGDRPRLEIFARTSTPGWDVWGNEVEKYPQ